MINLIAKNPSILANFLDKFRDIFSKHLYLSFCFYTSGLFLELKRTNIQSIADKCPSASYENLQYFISEGKLGFREA